MNFYKAQTIKASVKLSRYLEDQGVKMQGNRAVASWRDGKRASVSVDDEKGLWHDFVSEEGGDVIKMCIKLEGGDFISACRTLGDRYHLTPDKVSKKPPKATRGEILANEGYKLTRSYEYQDEDGTPRYWVDRWEGVDADGNRVKEFVQRGPNGENLHGVKRLLYHLPAVKAATRVFLCEGEKDADTLTGLGLTATTNSGGAKTWDPDFGQYFSGKDVIVMLDNDEAGQKRADIVVGTIAEYAKSVKTLTISKLPKGDVTDWLEKEGGTLSDLVEAVDAAPDADVVPRDVCVAKIANESPLTNYTIEFYEDDKGRRKTRRKPVPIDDICKEVATRFLGYPKVIGCVLFDYTRHGKKILRLTTNDELRAWINGTSGHQSEFIPGVGFANYKELMSRLIQTRKAYDVIAKAPWYPARDDAFYAFDPLPAPDAMRTKFRQFVDFFCPATPADKTLMKAFFAAPMFHTKSARPGWIMDTVAAQASGKTTVVKACSWLYDESPLQFDLAQMDADGAKVKREILSTEGRSRRLVLFDNVTTSLKSAALSQYITIDSITGMAPYGHTTETRKNDITWTATVNGAVVDTDLATRTYVIHVASPGESPDPHWEERLRAFINENRPQILADIMDMLAKAKTRTRKRSRFGEFDAVVLSGVCDSDAEFEAADAKIREASEAANDDADLAAQCVEAIVDALTRYRDTARGDEFDIRPDLPCVLKCTDVDNILRATSGGVRNWTSRTVRKFVNGGHIPEIIKGKERVDTADGRRFIGKARCMVFAANPDVLHAKTAQFVTFAGGIPKVVGVGTY